MTAFLLVISLLLNGVAIFSIIILYARQNRLVEVEKSQERMMKEMEEVISSYLIEMKEENEAFINRFQQLNPASFPESLLSNVPPNSPPINKTTPVLNLDGVDAEEKDWSEKAGKAFKKQAVKAYQNTAANKSEPTVKSDSSLIEETETNAAEKQPESKPEMADEEIYRDLFLDQVRLLQKRGYSIDDIAKKLNKGRTEIELLLKFG
jgi:hypothetical protein